MIDDTENLQISSSQFEKVLKNLVESNYIECLLNKQDVEDRQNIGLFGTKKNNEIMGHNSPLRSRATAATNT